MAVSKELAMVLTRHTDCESCSLCMGQKPLRPVAGWGPLTAKLVVVGEAPGTQEVRAGRPFTGRSGMVLWHELARRGVARESVYATNVLMCPTVQGKPMKAKDVEACSRRLWEELEDLHPRVILALGASAATALRGKPSRISELSGHAEWDASRNAFISYAYHSAAVLRNPDLYSDFAWAIQRAVEMLDEEPGELEDVPVEYQILSDTNLELFKDWYAVAEQEPYIICDLETTGLYPHADRILSVGLACTGVEDVWIVPAKYVETTPEVRLNLKKLLETQTVIGHNYKFDAHFLRAQWGFRAKVGGDTMLLHYAMDERSGGEGGGFHDLKGLARKYCDAPLYAENIDTSNTLAIHPTLLYRYQAYDVAYTLRLYHRLSKLILKEPPSRKGYPEPWEVYERLLIPAANMVLDEEERGVLIDVRKLLVTQEDYKRQLVDTQRLAVTQLAALGVTAPANLNIASPKQIQAILYEPRPIGLGYPWAKSTDEATIHELQREDRRSGREPNPFLETVLAYRSQKHTLTTYIEGTLKHIILGNPDGRLRTNLLIHGTSSGRFASRNPNLQNIPADSKVKELFVAPRGRILLNADYRRLEVGVLAYYSGDKELARDFAAADFHWNVAQKVFGKVTREMDEARARRDIGALEEICRLVSSLNDFARKQARPSERTEKPDELYDWMKTRLRRQAKYVSFGIMYGEGAFSLSQEEKGLGVPVEDAQRYIDMWKGSYRTAMAYLNEQVRCAVKYQWVESKSGRRRHFAYPLELAHSYTNEAMNLTIQAFASDIRLLAEIKLNRMLPELGLGNVLLSVHDSILFELDALHLDEAKTVIHDVMTGIVTDNPDIVFEIDMHTGMSWGACH